MPGFLAVPVIPFWAFSYHRMQHRLCCRRMDAKDLSDAWARLDGNVQKLGDIFKQVRPTSGQPCLRVVALVSSWLTFHLICCIVCLHHLLDIRP